MRSSPALLLAFASLLPLAACAPDLGTAPSPRSAASLAATRSLPDENGAWPGDGWWKRYNDPQLDALIEEGLAGSPDIATAVARLARAEGLARAAGGAASPTLDASGSATAIKQLDGNGLPDTFNLTGWPHIEAVSLRGGFDLDLWGKNRAKLRAALKDAEAARVEAAQARIMLAAAIAQAYADLARLHAARDIADQALRIQMDTAGLVSDRVRNGLDTEGQRRQAAAQVPAARADLAALDEQITIARNELAALIGAGPDRGLAIERPKLSQLTALVLPPSAGSIWSGAGPISSRRARGSRRRASGSRRPRRLIILISACRR